MQSTANLYLLCKFSSRADLLLKKGRNKEGAVEENYDAEKQRHGGAKRKENTAPGIHQLISPRLCVSASLH
jgi:hypothetical protein